MVSDYIGLPDGTFGKVESIGLCSTKIRISGKGTLMVVPNNYLGFAEKVSPKFMPLLTKNFLTNQ